MNTYKIKINELESTFSKKIDFDGGTSGYTLGFIQKDFTGDKIWYSTIIQEKFLWKKNKFDGSDYFEMLIPDHFVYKFKGYNTETKTQLDKEITFSSDQLANLVLNKDSKNVITSREKAKPKQEKVQPNPKTEPKETFDIDNIKF